MYDPVVMYFSFSMVNKLRFTSVMGHNIMIYKLIFTGTTELSYLSYTYVELYYLKLKHKFSPIISGRI